MSEEVRWASYSQLATHRSCPQRWYYANVRRLERVESEGERIELEFGSWWHALRAADSIERGRVLGSLKVIPTELRTTDHGPTFDTASTSIHDDVLVGADKWFNALSLDAQEAWRDRLGGDLVERLTYVEDRWNERWKEDMAYEQPMAVELDWKRPLPPLPQQEGQDPIDPFTLLVGYVDEVFYDSRRHMVVVRDHKTSKSLGTQSVADDMLDSQLQIYAWGASPMVSEWGRGKIKAVAYDRVRSVAPKTPKVTISGTLSKSITDFDAHTYAEWSYGLGGQGVPFDGRAKDGSQAGYYTTEESVLTKLRQPDSLSVWQQRTLTPLNANVIRSHLRAAVDTALDMNATDRRSRVSGEAGRNFAGHCRWCDFNKLCRAELIGGSDGDYELADFGLRSR